MKFGEAFFAWLAILGLLPLVIRAVMNGWLSVKWAGILMIVLVLANLVGIRKFVFKAVLPLLGIYLLAMQYSNGNTKTFEANLFALLTLSIALFGIWIMFRGVFGSSRSKKKE